MTLTITETASQPVCATDQDKATADSISYTISACALGQVLLARSVSGVCAILIGASEQELEADLAALFPKSTLSINKAGVYSDLEKVIRFAARPGEGLDLALDLRGTTFQRRVWETLRMIPVGTTVTYSELARRVGAPNSARAVAGACASSPIALAIPCHRAVRRNGDLAGYRWGVERKRQLIEREAMA
jgi:AraC family transcriptional regulator, regulatory protein of adaptative response / methylated-DNA-[protein]-cysteine methyltransferase